MAPEGQKNESTDSGAIAIELDARQFSRDAVLRATHWFTREWDIAFLPSNVEWRIELVFRSKSAAPSRDANRLRGDFAAALLDAELRLQIGRETTNVRELILAKAFAEAGVLEPDE